MSVRTWRERYIKVFFTELGSRDTEMNLQREETVKERRRYIQLMNFMLDFGLYVCALITFCLYGFRMWDRA
jgi:hypothetical protein